MADKKKKDGYVPVDQDSDEAIITESVIERRKQLAFWVRIGSAIGVAYQISWCVAIGFGLYDTDDNCDDKKLTHFMAGAFWTLIFLFPFVAIMFFASILVAKEKVYQWNPYFLASTIIVSGFDLFLLIASSVIYALTVDDAHGPCARLEELLRGFIITTCVVVSIILLMIGFIFWAQMRACCCPSDEDKEDLEAEKANEKVDVNKT